MGSSSNNNTTLQDLAQLAGVSISTVSRALNDHPLISARTKQKIWALARDHDYPFRPYMPAAPVGAEGTIVIVTPFMRGRPLPLSHPFFLELLASIGEAARARDCDFTVSHTTPANYEDLVATTTTSRASGVIFLGQSMLHDAFNQLTESNANFVVWGAQMAGQLYCLIGSDNQLGGRRATAHLARLGRKAILFLGGTDPESMQRKRGYNEALKEASRWARSAPCAGRAYRCRATYRWSAMTTCCSRGFPPPRSAPSGKTRSRPAASSSRASSIPPPIPAPSGCRRT